MNKVKIKWKCTRCGKCCLTVPCIFAQVKYNITSRNRKMCPELKKNGSDYKCLLIERDSEVRGVLISGDCDSPALSHLKKGINAASIVREFFPNATSEQINNILWDYTGYPEFWDIPKDGWTATQCLRKQLRDLKSEATESKSSRLYRESML